MICGCLQREGRAAERKIYADRPAGGRQSVRLAISGAYSAPTTLESLSCQNRDARAQAHAHKSTHSHDTYRTKYAAYTRQVAESGQGAQTTPAHAPRNHP